MLPPPATFDSLYRKHAPSVFRRARSILGNEADAHEVVQDLFLSYYERPEQWRGQSAISTFLYSATTHACLNRLRDQRNRIRLLQERVAHGAGQSPATDNATVVRSVLDKLPPPLGEIAVYYYVDELTHDEIATLLSCSRRHVGNCIERLHEWGRAHASADPNAKNAHSNPNAEPQKGEVSCSKN